MPKVSKGVQNQKRADGREKAGQGKEAMELRVKRFIGAYLENGGNQAAAARAAGYSPQTAIRQANRLMARPEVKRAIASMAKRVAAKIELSVERTLLEVARVAYSDPRKFFKEDGTMVPLHELPDDVAAVLASVETDELKEDGKIIGSARKIKLWDKNSALEKAMKYHGLYKEDNAQHPVLPNSVLIEFVRAPARKG